MGGKSKWHTVGVTRSSKAAVSHAKKLQVKEDNPFKLSDHGININ